MLCTRAHVAWCDVHQPRRACSMDDALPCMSSRTGRVCLCQVMLQAAAPATCSPHDVPARAQWGGTRWQALSEMSGARDLVYGARMRAVLCERPAQHHAAARPHEVLRARPGPGHLPHGRAHAELPPPRPHRPAVGLHAVRGPRVACRAAHCADCVPPEEVPETHAGRPSICSPASLQATAGASSCPDCCLLEVAPMAGLAPCAGRASGCCCWTTTAR